MGVRKRPSEIEGQLSLDIPMCVPPSQVAEENPEGQCSESKKGTKRNTPVKKGRTEVPLSSPAPSADRPAVPDLLWQALKNGAGRPGARYAIERAVKEYPPLSYEPVRTAIAVLRDMDTEGIKFRQRGIFVPGHGWFTWTTLLSRVREAVEAGEWMTDTERRKERAACETVKSKKGWNL